MGNHDPLQSEQEDRLGQGKVLIVGAGGLGTSVAARLVESGVGRIGLVDGDRVDITNLHRQLLYREQNIGDWKVEAAYAALHQNNPQCHLEKWAERLTQGNVERIAESFDIVACCVDNFSTRYLLNDYCFFFGKTLVDGGALQWNGNVSVWKPGREGACLRCLLPDIPSQAQSPTCSRVGVLGPLCGIVGNHQAAEVIKLLTGEGETLLSHLLTVDARTLEFRKVVISRNAQCALCGEGPEIETLSDSFESIESAAVE